MGRQLIWLLRRAALLAVVAWIVATGCFWCLHALPGDLALQVAAARYVESAPDADLAAATRAELGLDRPLPAQYADWLGKLLSLDFGRSLITGRDVLSDLAPYVANTLLLGTLGLAGGAMIAMPFGIAAAVVRSAIVKRLADIWSAVFSSIPAFLLAALAVEFFTVGWGIGSLSGGPDAQRLLFPALIASIMISAPLTQIIRNAAEAVVRAPFYTFAQMRGVPLPSMLRHHVAPNAAVPIISYAATLFVFVIYDLVVIEIVFNYPGIGRALLDAVLARDVPVVQAAVLVLVFTYLTITTLADLVVLRLTNRLARPDGQRA